MKTENILIVAAAGLATYFLLKNKNNNPDAEPVTNTVSIAPGYVTPAGNVIPQSITSPAEGVKYINDSILNQKRNEARNNIVTIQPVNNYLPDSSYVPPNVALSVPSGASSGSRRILAPAKGGGYVQVGASNISHANAKPITSNKTITLKSGKTYRLNN